MVVDSIPLQRTVNSEISRGFFFGKFLNTVVRIGEITPPLLMLVHVNHAQSQNFYNANMSFNIPENKVLAKISEFTICTPTQYALYNLRILQ